MREPGPNTPLTILYEDEWLIAVDKPAGQMVHPADVPSETDQVTMKILRDQIGQYVYPVHRLDRPTTGVLLFTKDSPTAKQLNRALERHAFHKIYLAVVHGVTPASWECREPLRKTETAPVKDCHTSFRMLRSVDHPQLAALNASEGSTLSLIEAVPHTGRYHQIRRHLCHKGIPIVGDYRYAGIERSDELGERLGTGTRMLLQAKELRLTHPVSEKECVIIAPLESLIDQCFPA